MELKDKAGENIGRRPSRRERVIQSGFPAVFVRLAAAPV